MLNLFNNINYPSLEQAKRNLADFEAKYAKRTSSYK